MNQNGEFTHNGALNNINGSPIGAYFNTIYGHEFIITPSEVPQIVAIGDWYNNGQSYRNMVIAQIDTITGETTFDTFYLGGSTNNNIPNSANSVSPSLDMMDQSNLDSVFIVVNGSSTPLE